MKYRERDFEPYYVQPGLNLDAAEIRRVRRHADLALRESHPWRYRSMAVALTLIAGAATCTGVSTIMVLATAMGGDLRPSGALGMLAIVITAFVHVIRARSRRRRRIRIALRACGHAVCERCGYVMTGLPDHTPCPECGHESETPVITDRRTLVREDVTLDQV